VQAILITRAYQ